MGDAMPEVVHYLNVILAFFENGLRDGFANVNGALGIIIALVAAYMLASWKRIWAMALGATIVHLIAEIMIPVLANRAQFALPPDLLHLSYWKTAVALYLGYLIVIAVFFFIKRNVLPRSAPAH
jgi:uncharacterized protein YacL